MKNKTQALTPTDIVIFGGNGDLALRKIMPALYHRLRDGQLPKTGKIIGVARKEMSRKDYVALVREAFGQYVPKADFDKNVWKAFSDRIFYAHVEAQEAGSYGELKKLLDDKPVERRMFYLATPASVFGPISYNLHATGLANERSRVVIEKPLGHDLESFREINNAVLECFSEQQVYRIDHYLGKETVQNLMVLRFANHMFERLWKGDAIDHVQITVAETVGVEARESYYDKYGALRDMVQNHLLQLLCLVAMEPPAQISPDAVRDEKLKVLRSLRPITDKDVAWHTVKGQYKEGKLKGKSVPAYRKEVGRASDTETFVAIKAHVDNWRWSGVPFYLRTGKRLAERFSEIAIQFRPVPHHIFPDQDSDPETNKLIIRLQPDESVKLQMVTKVPGPGGYRLKPVNLNLSLADTFNERTPDAYERLLMDVVRGNPTLFMRSDEVEEAWKWTEGILNGWKKTGQEAKSYVAGSWGPQDAQALMERDNRKWHEDLN
ncbi:MAG: glucose-6-phosphate dehydrogenase [Alphaproteobacteria bacterium]|nr:glucose-6-phosphate dehydrogenase [Alphaproteobacteria bacterium]